MDSEQLFFLKTLSDYIHQRKTSIPDKIDLKHLDFYAKEHQVGPIFFKQTKLDIFRDAFFQQINLQMHQTWVMEELNRLMDGIPYFTLKGVQVAKYYPNPELRIMSDLDYVVHPEDKEKVCDRLIKWGAELQKKSEGEWIFSKDAILIELHSALVYDYSQATTNIKQRDFFNSCWDYYKNGKVDFNFHMLFLFMHLRKHIMETGVGFRQFMDIAILKENAQIDWDWIRTKAEELDLFPFIKTAMSMIEKWFDVKSPFENATIRESFFESATQHIFDDGAFGFDNIANRNNRAINEKKRRENRLYGAKYFCEQFFWPYEKLISMPEYKWLKNKKWLLPIAWGYRSIRKWKNKDVLIMRYFATDKAVRKRYEYLDQWNIRNN